MLLRRADRAEAKATANEQSDDDHHDSSRRAARELRGAGALPVRRVSQAAAKVTWPSRKETLITTAMVFVMSIAAAIFFVVVDSLLSFGVSRILALGGFGG
jgi:preprotein translocase subunit SecE